MGPLRLTDDEVVAVAFARRAAWPTALPSLRKGADDIREAGFRGARSIMVRAGSLPEDDLQATAGRVLEPHRTVLVTPTAGSPENPGTQLVVHAFPDGVVAERILADGVHEFRRTGRVAAVAEIVEAVTDGDVDVSQVNGPTVEARIAPVELAPAGDDRVLLRKLLVGRLSLIAELADDWSA